MAVGWIQNLVIFEMLFLTPQISHTVQDMGPGDLETQRTCQMGHDDKVNFEYSKGFKRAVSIDDDFGIICDPL